MRAIAVKPRSMGGRLGAAAFLFFLVKGILWLAVPALLCAIR